MTTKELLHDKSFRLSILVTIGFLSVGILFLTLGLADYNFALFLVMPLVLGFSVGSMTRLKWAYYGLVAGILTILIFLVAGGMEGLICVLMALPIFIPLVFIGTLIALLVRKKDRPPRSLHVHLAPLLIFIFVAPSEKYLFGDKVISEVRSEIILPYSAIDVYNSIKSVDTLIAEKPFLMKLDLPVPQKCVLEKEEIGALRTCYFDGGKIVERITELKPGEILKMDVVSYDLTGAKWLGFKEAIYTFEETQANACKMVRITTYTSSLKPRFYWESLEKLGIEQEHEYVFRNLVRDLSLLEKNDRQ